MQGGGGKRTSERGQQQQQQHQGRSALGVRGVRGHSVRRTAYSVQPGQDVRVSIYLGNLQRERLFCDMTDGNRTRVYVLYVLYTTRLPRSD